MSEMLFFLVLFYSFYASTEYVTGSSGYRVTLERYPIKHLCWHGFLDEIWLQRISKRPRGGFREQGLHRNLMISFVWDYISTRTYSICTGKLVRHTERRLCADVPTQNTPWTMQRTFTNVQHTENPAEGLGDASTNVRSAGLGTSH